MWMMMPTKLTTMEMRTSTSILSSGLCRDFLGGKLDKLRKNCECCVSGSLIEMDTGQLIRQKVEVDKWNGCGWLMSTCGLKLFERRHEVMLLEDFPVNPPETRVIRVRAMLIQDISEM